MRRLARLSLVLATGAAFVAGAAETRLTEAAVRAFVVRQDAAWNARDAKAFAATFAPDAVFVAQAVGSDGKLHPNGRSTLAEATAQARRFFGKSNFRQTTAVDRVTLAPDARSAKVLAQTVTRIERPEQPPRSYCAHTEQTLILTHGRVVSQGQTDTDIRCPR